MDRYSKQRLFLGREADGALRTKRVAVLGLGALGSVIAPWLARAGVGHLTLIDRDLVEASNLQRQLLYGESDLGRPKAEVAAQRLAEANSTLDLRPVVADLTSGNARELLSGFDLICDGTDNFEARFLINDLARFDFWQDERQFLKPPRTRCRYCTEKITEFLDARWTLKASPLCGLEGVQIRVNPPGKLDLGALKARLETRTRSPWKQIGSMLKGQEGPDEITLFADGRALVHGPMTPERARSWYTEVVGC